jgi:hypothetical protein
MTGASGGGEAGEGDEADANGDRLDLGFASITAPLLCSRFDIPLLPCTPFGCSLCSQQLS